jgi:hypothetical protein
VPEDGVKLNRISYMTVAYSIVRNDEVVGSIPTSSTKSSLTRPAVPRVPIRPLSRYAMSTWRSVA